MALTRIRLTTRRKQFAVALALVVVFCVALVLWVGPSDKGSALPAAPSASGISVGPGGGSTAPGSGTKPTASATASGLPGLPGFPGLQLPDTTKLLSLGPGKHRIVLTATSDQPLLAVSYSVKGDASGKVVYNAKSPVAIGRTVSGGRPYGIIALQVGPNGTTGSCRITIDGKEVDTRRYNAPYAVMQCVG